MNAVEIAWLVGGIVGALAFARMVLEGLLRIEDAIVSIPDMKNTSFDEIKRLSHEYSVVLATQGVDFDRKNFVKKILPSIKAVCEEKGCHLFLADIGGLICLSPLTKFLSTNGVKHDAVHMMKDGRILASVKMQHPSSFKPSEWIDAIHSLLSEHSLLHEEAVKICPACGRQQRGTATFCRGCGVKLA